MQLPLSASPHPSDSTRGSVTARIARWFAFATAQPILHVMPWNATTTRATRRLCEIGMPLVNPAPTGTVVSRVDEADVHGEWVNGPRVSRTKQVIFYVHGSGYAICSARTHRGLVARLSVATGLAAFSCDYRLAPEHVFPAAADDVTAAFEWLVTQGFSAGDIVLAGDSAGCHLLVDLTLELARRGHEQPRAMILLSPAIDLTIGNVAAAEPIQRDPIFTARAARRLVGMYTAGRPSDTPRLQLDFSSAKSLPPTLIQAGTAEIFAADAQYLTRVLRQAGVECVLQLWPDQMHGFQAFPAIPEAAAAIEQIAKFVSELDANAAPQMRPAK